MDDASIIIRPASRVNLEKSVGRGARHEGDIQRCVSLEGKSLPIHTRHAKSGPPGWVSRFLARDKGFCCPAPRGECGSRAMESTGVCTSVQRTTDSLRLCAARENLTQAAEVRLCGAKNRRLPCLEQPLRRLRAVIVQPVSYMKTPVQMHRRFCGCRQTPFIPAGVAEQFLTTGRICFFFPKAAGRATIDKKDDAAIAARRVPI